MARLRRLYAKGTLSAEASATATSLSSAGFSSLPVVAAPDDMMITLDPAATAGVPELVRVTAHTSGATTVTVERGQEQSEGGAAGRIHAVNTPWAHAPIPSDLSGEPWRYIGTAGQPGFQNAWVNYGGVHDLAAFRMTSTGWVELKGLIKSGTVGAAAFQLPAGYQSTRAKHIAVASNGAFGYVRVQGSTTDGTGAGGVGGIVPTVGSNAWFDLSGVRFHPQAD